VPTTINRAVLLAKLEHDVLDNGWTKFQSGVGGPRGVPMKAAEASAGGLSLPKVLKNMANHLLSVYY
jgi:hypothetical protein